MDKQKRDKIRQDLIQHIRTAPFEQLEKELKSAGLGEYAKAKAGQVDDIVIFEIESHIESMLIEAEEHAKMGDYAKALSLKEQTTGFKRAIDVIRKHLSQ